MAIYMYREGGTPWIPGANTLCYYTFNNTLADASGNHVDATNNGTSFTTVANRKVLDITSNTYVTLPGTIVPNLLYNFTILFWVKTTTSSAWFGGPTYDTYEYPGTMVLGDTDKAEIVYGGGFSSRRSALGDKIVNDGVWHLVSYRGNNTQNWIVGTDNNFNTTYVGNNTTTYGFGTGEITLGRRSTTDASSIVCQVGDFIIEDKTWTSQEISDYIDRTKSLYGIN